MTSIPLQNVNTANTIIWTGASGTRYEFYNHPIGTVFRAEPGVYVFSRFNAGLYYSVYVGETDDFSRRLTNELAGHHQGPSIARDEPRSLAGPVRESNSCRDNPARTAGGFGGGNMIPRQICTAAPWLYS